MGVITCTAPMNPTGDVTYTHKKFKRATSEAYDSAEQQKLQPQQHSLQQKQTQPHPRDPSKHEKTEVNEAGARPTTLTVCGQPPVNGHISSPLVHQEGCNAGGHLSSCDAEEVKKNNGNGGGKYKCEYCGMGCAKPSVLGKHIRTHTNERPYRCDQCQTAFKTKSNYLKHTKSRAHANRCDGVAQDGGDGHMELGDCLETEVGDNLQCPSLERGGSPQSQPADLSVARASLRDQQHNVLMASASAKTQQEEHLKEKGKSLYKPKFRAQYALHDESIPKVNTPPSVRHQPTPPLETSQPECNAVNPVTYQSHAASNSNSPNRHAASPANFAKQCLPPLDVRVAPAGKKDELVLAGQRSSVVTPQSANSIWKGMKSPSPELLGQHITKLIVENQAIVETHNPLWAKRYRRQSSLGSSSSESDGSGSGKSRRGSLVDASGKSSKLAAIVSPASYGLLQSHSRERSLSLTGDALMMEPQSSYSPSLPPNSPHLALAQPPNSLMSASKPSISSLGPTTSYSQSDPTFATSHMGMHELDLADGSRKRSISDAPGVVRDLNKMRLHPKNPEGSVIKNLLLTARSGINSTIDHNLEKLERIQSQNAVLICSWCRARFPNPENLEYHLRHCLAYRQGGSGSERGTPDSVKSGEGGRWSGEQDMALDLQKKERPLDRYDRERSSSRGSSVSLGESGQRRPSDEDIKYRMDFYRGESSLDGASPPTKKRKLSEADVSTLDKNRFLSPIFSPKSQIGGKNESAIKMMEKPSSRHLFGGEVQICDGKNLKTMRIDPDQQPNPTLDICIPPQQLGGSITRTEVSVPTSVVVTIAKSGLNSGGTMVQVESQMSTSSTKTAPSLVNSLLPQEKPKPENSVHTPAKVKAAAPPTNIYPGNPSQFPFPHMFHQYAPLLPLPNLTIPGIPTPDLGDLSYPMNPPNMTSQPFIHGQSPHAHKQNSHHLHATPSRVSPLTLCQPSAGGITLSNVTGVPGIRGSSLNANLSAVSTAVLREKEKEHHKAASKLPSSYPALIPIGNEKVPYVPGIPGPYSQAGSVVHPSNSIQKSPLPIFAPPVPAPSISPVTSKGSKSSESTTSQGVMSEGKEKMLSVPRPRDILKEHQRNPGKEISPHKDSLKYPPKMVSYVSPKESQIQGDRPKQPMPQIKVPEMKSVNPEIRIHPAISSPPREDKKDLEKGHISAEAQNSENSGKTVSSHSNDFLPPRKRPNTLALKPQPFTPKSLSLIGTTLVSPDTPRPKKNCVQMLLNGSAYTYLNHKVSTKSYFCCIYRQQPMYVPQSTDPKLSMYSNWQIRKPAEDNPFELTPYQSLGLYESRKYNESQKYNQYNATYTIAKEKELNLIQTHSSYWTFKEEKEKNKEKEKEESKMKTDEKDAKGDNPEKEVSEQNAAETSGVAIKREPDDLDSSNITYKNDEADGSGEGFAKRIKIFEGGFKSTEDYTYVRGRGRGRYVCEACGIRCKKPSMLKKHIRTHTDLRPYSCGHCSFSFKTKGNLTKHLRSKAHYKRCVEMGIFPVPTVVDESHINEEALALQGKMEQDRAEDDDDDEDDEDDDDDDDGDDEDDDGAMDEDQFEDAEEFKDIKETNCDKDQDGRPIKESNDGRDIIVPAPQVSRAGVLVMMPIVSSTLDSSNAAYCSPDNKGSKTSGGVDSSRDSPMDLSVKKTATPATSPVHDKVSLGKKHSVPMRPNFLPLMSKSVVAELRSPGGNLGSPGTPSTPIREHPSEILSPVTESSTLLKSIYSTTHRISSVSSGESQNIVPDPTKENGCSSSMLQAYLKERAVRDIAFKRQQYKSSSSDTSPDSPKAGAVQPSSELGKLSTENEKLPRKMEDSREAAKVRPDNDIKEPTEENTSQGFCSEQTRSSTPSSLSTLTVVTSSLNTSCVVTSSQAVSSRMPTPPANLTVMYSGGVDTKTAFLVPIGVVPSSLNRLGNDDGKCKCSVCHKEFNKQSQLSIHMNIHYMERPYRCGSCGVSFRTNGHLQKHRRSLSHFNKVNMNLTFGTPSTDNPRPFKCHDCKIAFRIHGHLAKHLRSKMHIMKLECLGKLPFGTYAEIERSGANLNEIDTTDCDNSLESLQAMASRLYEKDPSKLAALQTQQERLHHRVRTVSNSSTNSDDYPLQDEQDDPLSGCGNDDDTEGDEDEELPLPHEAGRISISGTVLGPPSSESHSPQPNALQTIEVGSGATAGLVACYLCHEKFLDLEHLSGHLYNVHKQQLTQPTNQPFSCGICEAKFSSYSQLMIHSQHNCSSAGIVGLKSS